jgi:hypothetical protein
LVSLPHIPLGKIISNAREGGLHPGQKVAFGLHYRLQYVDGEELQLRIYGQTADGNRKVMIFDPETGTRLD